VFDHVKFGVSDYAASKAFFLKALEPLGVAAVAEGPPTYGVELCAKGNASLCLYQTGEKPAHLHLAFTAENRQQVEAFYRAALEAGGKDNGAPGLRRTITRTTMQLSSLVRTATTSKWFATNSRPNPSIRTDAHGERRPRCVL
jgi:catechol 2,3-dioxygenase-like lactoylglutathione lyase family enzyme